MHGYGCTLHKGMGVPLYNGMDVHFYNGMDVHYTIRINAHLKDQLRTMKLCSPRMQICPTGTLLSMWCLTFTLWKKREGRPATPARTGIGGRTDTPVEFS